MIAAALDTSCGTSLAISRDGCLVHEAHLAVEGRGNDRELVPWLMAELAKAGIPHADIRPIAPSLEDVFVALTAGRDGERR